jgi:hypothetical protein
MRIPFPIIVALAVVALVAAVGATTYTGSVAKKPVVKRELILYYFHRTIRCAECRTIENAAQSALRRAFARELSSGRVAWRPTNLDEDANAHFEARYALEHQSLVLSEIVGGKEKRWKLLEKTWDIYRDSTALRNYVIDETRAFLRGK